eukprot:1101911-Rhodomonas_salina.1
MAQADIHRLVRHLMLQNIPEGQKKKSRQPKAFLSADTGQQIAIAQLSNWKTTAKRRGQARPGGCRS